MASHPGMSPAGPTGLPSDHLEWVENGIIIACGIIGIAFAAFCAWAVSRVQVDPRRQSEESTHLMTDPEVNTASVRQKIYEIGEDIALGAKTFLFSEYKIMAIFMAMMALTIVLLYGGVQEALWEECPHGKPACAWIDGIFSAIAFLVGSFTSIVSGYIGMRIAVFTNTRTCLKAEEGYAPAFATAFKGGIVMGFGLTSVGLLSLWITIKLFGLYYTVPADGLTADILLARTGLMSAIAPFGLGGSSIALFGRVGGGIFTKAADVGADLVGKVEHNIPEDDPRNPGVIADNVGDNVGDIAGMGSDLFGSFGEATCAALVVSTTSTEILERFTYLFFPLMITAAGIITCLVTSFVATHLKPPKEQHEIEPALKYQLIISTVLNTGIMALISRFFLPVSFDMAIIFLDTSTRRVHWWHAYLCIMFGLWSGLIIGLLTEYYTSHARAPTRHVANACLTGAATNVIHGLALGYESAIVPCFCIAFSIFASFAFAGAYGVALAALGILSTMAIGLTIDAYGPISDNAGGIAEMSGMGERVRERTDALDAAGNTTAAIGKGFAIGSAAFVAVALFGAFETQVNHPQQSGIIVNLLDPRTFFGLVVGAMLPYWFSAMTMKSVGTAAMEMVREIQRQFHEIPGLMQGDAKPNHEACVAIATNASLKEMLMPGALVVLTPLVTGILFGPEALAGLLPGSMSSGVMMAISAANTGGAWDNAKKYIEAGHLAGHGKGSEAHKAAVIGDTVGDPLKDTSGPALNILVKLMAIISVVFAPIMRPTAKTSGLFFNKLICDRLSNVCP